MIAEHESNSKWWGGRVGIIKDPEFFTLPKAKRQELLTGFDWVEYKTEISSAPTLATLKDSSFFLVDVQLHFRIALNKVIQVSSSEINITNASIRPFSVDASSVKPFLHERYLTLPGMTQPRLDARYVTWANQLIQENPKHSLMMEYKDKLQGWFLSKPEKEGLNLTLAMLSNDASISGFSLYQNALIHYGNHGSKLGFASFSVSNVDVLNIYSKLGAHFSKPTGCWLWYKSN